MHVGECGSIAAFESEPFGYSMVASAVHLDPGALGPMLSGAVMGPGAYVNASDSLDVVSVPAPDTSDESSDAPFSFATYTGGDEALWM